ncbi:Ftsk gamma domain-containing protein [Opitutaceae bacterium TAV1]|nr:Ftsk gamma domain-containing protein [Opitutaceae bacterium TAV1]
MTNEPPLDDESRNRITPLGNLSADQFTCSEDRQTTDDALLDEKLSQAGELYEDVHDIFRMAQRASTMMIKHSLKISHASAARIMEA